MDLSPTLERVVIVLLVGALAYTNWPAPTPAPPEPQFVDGMWVLPEQPGVTEPAEVDKAGKTPRKAREGDKGRDGRSKKDKGEKRPSRDADKADEPTSEEGAADATERKGHVEMVEKQTATMLQAVANAASLHRWPDDARAKAVTRLEERRVGVLEAGADKELSITESKTRMRQVGKATLDAMRADIGDESFEQYQEQVRELTKEP